MPAAARYGCLWSRWGRETSAFEAVLEANRERKAVAVVTTLRTANNDWWPRKILAGDPLGAVLEEAFRFDQSGLHGGEFVHVHNPPVAAGDHRGRAYCAECDPDGRQAGYDVSVIDPRGAFATGARFPDIALIPMAGGRIAEPRRLMRARRFWRLPMIPRLMIRPFPPRLKSECFYIGALGSKKTQASRVERLQKMGFSDEEIAPDPRAYRPAHRRQGRCRNCHFHHGRNDPLLAPGQLT